MASRDTPARSHLDAFRKVLELERGKAYSDTAVLGGMDRFLERRGQEITSAVGEEAKELLAVSYGGLSLAQREEWVGGWLARLRTDVTGTDGDSQAKQATQVRARAPKGTQASGRTIADKPPLPGASLESPINRLKGADVKTSARLGRLGVTTMRDLLYLLPRHHNDFSKMAKINELVPGQEHTIVATVWEARETKLGRRLKATEAVVSDETGNMRVIWFGQPYVARTLKPNSRVSLSGKVEVYRGQPQLQSPEFELLDRQESLIHTGRLVPVYPLTEGLTPRKVRGLVWQALEGWASLVEDFLPEDLRTRASVIPLQDAIMQVHYPEDHASYAMARRRLAFDELLLVQLAVLTRRNAWQESVEGVPIPRNPQVMESFRSSLPFTLTEAQERCLGEVVGDMERSAPPMNRLLEGEVGSGKTVVALAALLAAVAAGYQGSIMVPTEVLAEQHFATVSSLLGGLTRPTVEEGHVSAYLQPLSNPISVGLLTSSTRPAVKRELQRRIAEGTLDILIGTHALIQEGVEIPRLALAVVDEQHRFGVSQRAALRQKGGLSPHVLVMSATPIPRTLALTVYGDLDISIIDQLPPGRQRVLTRQVADEKRGSAYDFVRREVINGRQAFFIFPLIEESEAVEARAATEEHERLSSQVFPDLRLGLLHGRMSSKDKDVVMRGFRDGDIDILVSTPVVEVGIDVPNATVMVVEGAHRFGLAQLHQFRGRVGRGEHKSYCLLLSEYSSSDARQRLQAMEDIHDGFQLAEVDLELRGPGDFFGTRQSGLPTLKAASLSDQELLKLARDEATGLLADDPYLKRTSHEGLAREVSRFLEGVRDEVS